MLLPGIRSHLFSRVEGIEDDDWKEFDVGRQVGEGQSKLAAVLGEAEGAFVGVQLKQAKAGFEPKASLVGCGN